MVLKALIDAKIKTHKICGSSFLSSFSGASGGLLGIQIAGSASSAVGSLEGLVAELKSIAKASPDIDVLKKKVINIIVWKKYNSILFKL